MLAVSGCVSFILKLPTNQNGLFPSLIIVRVVQGICYGLSFDEEMTTQIKKDSSFLALLYLASPAFSHDYSVLYILFGISMVVTALIGFCLHGTRRDFDRVERILF